MAATVAVLALAGTGSMGSAAGSTARPAAAASAVPASAVRRRGVRARRPGRPGQTVSTTQASVAPNSATANVNSGAPPTAAQPRVGASAWLIASRPHGKPHGQRSRSASAATHQPATANGQAGSFSKSLCPTASTAKMTASAAASVTQAYQARLITQASRGKKKAAPKTSPTQNEARSDRPDNAITSSAGPAAASGQIPAGGNAAASASPPASAVASAQRSRSSGASGCWCGTVSAPALAWAGITYAG